MILRNFHVLHMVLNIGRIYNNLVNRQQFIHLFLIATLCFGQLAASTHIVRHVHDHHSTGDMLVAGTDSKAQATFTRVTKLRQSLAHLAENVDDEGGVDCSIYHSFSSLCGTFTSPGSVAVGWSQLGAILPTNESHVALATSDNQRIRAPPALS